MLINLLQDMKMQLLEISFNQGVPGFFIFIKENKFHIKSIDEIITSWYDSFVK